jgi:hypothetical protein
MYLSPILTIRKLRSKVSEILSIQYLVKATEADANNMVKVGQGTVYSHTFYHGIPNASYEDEAHLFYHCRQLCPSQLILPGEHLD